MVAETENRKHAVIMFADVAGYSRLVGLDETGTYARLKALRLGILEPLIRAYGGRIIQLTGDGVFVEIVNALDAAECAIAIQRSIGEQNIDLPESDRLMMRIGLHAGDVLLDEDNVFGDTVNIAARLEKVAEPGGICLSAEIYEEIVSSIGEVFEDGGTPPLKNIIRPVRVWLWPPSGRRGPWSPLPLPDKPSIAVLPFANFTGKPEDEWLADGIVEDLTTALGRLDWLFVVARTSAFAFKGQSPDVREAARRLGVRYVLEGSVRRAGSQVRVTGQLIDASTGSHLWAGRFDGNPRDAFDLQDQITESVAAAIEPELLNAEIAKARFVRPEDMAAHDYYLRALGLMTAAFADVRDSRFDEARALLKEAIGRDPNYAPALALAAHFEVMAGLFGRDSDSHDDPLELAERAFRADRNDPVVLAHYAFVLATIKSGTADLERATAIADRAIALNQNSPFIWSFSGEIRMYLGDHETAIDHLHRSMRLNPLDNRTIWNSTFLSFAHFFMRRPAEALKWAERAALTNHNPVTLRALAIARVESGQVAAARTAIETLLELQPNSCLSRSSKASYNRPQDLDYYIEALRKAGLPE